MSKILDGWDDERRLEGTLPPHAFVPPPSAWRIIANVNTPCFACGAPKREHEAPRG